MEGTRPEDVSLLASGGAEPTLIPVQGGGGGGSGSGLSGLSGGGSAAPWEGYNESESVLQEGASEDPNIRPVSGGGTSAPTSSGAPTSGGGLPDIFGWLAGQATSAAAPPTVPIFNPQSFNPETAFNTMWSGLDPPDQVMILSSTAQAGAQAAANGADSASMAEIVPNALINNTLDAIDRKYGTTADITDPKIQQSLKYGTDEQLQAGREAYVNGTAAGLPVEKLNKSIIDAMNAKSKTDTVHVSPMALSIDRAIVPQSSQKAYRTFQDKTVFRNEYQINVNNEMKDEHPMIIWAEKVKYKYLRREKDFTLHLRDYIKQQTAERNRISGMSKVSAAHIAEAKLDVNNNYVLDDTKVSALDRRVACLGTSIEHIVVIPSLAFFGIRDLSADEKLLLILRDLYDLNILKVDETKYTCTINKKVALVFSEVYNTTTELESAEKIFLYTSLLEIANKSNVFCLANFNEGDRCINVGLDLMNKYLKKNESSRILTVPTLLSPSHVIFPYKLLNGVSGVIISMDKTKKKKDMCATNNIFTKIYGNRYYGKAGFGLFVKPGYPFITCNTGLIRYNCGDGADFLYEISSRGSYIPRTFEAEKNDGKTMGEIGETALNTLPIVKERTDAIIRITGKSFIEIAIAMGPHKLYFGRNQFIVYTEILLYIYNNFNKFVAALGLKSPVDDNKISELKQYLKVNINHKKYIRYPLTKPFSNFRKIGKYYHNLKNNPIKNLDRVYEDNEYELSVQSGGSISKKKKRGLLIGGNSPVCGDMSIKGQATPLGKYDVEQISPFTIFVLSIEKDMNADPVCKLNTSQQDSKVAEEFMAWPNEREIADIFNLEIIDVGAKTYAVRVGTEGVQKNWQGYKGAMTGGGELAEYEKQYEELLSEITTTMGVNSEIMSGGDATIDSTNISQLRSSAQISSISTFSSISTIDTFSTNTSTSTFSSISYERPYYLYTVKVIRKDGTVFSFTVKSTGLIIDLKIMVAAATGIPVSEQHMFNPAATTTLGTTTTLYDNMSTSISSISSPTDMLSSPTYMLSSPTYMLSTPRMIGGDATVGDSATTTLTIQMELPVNAFDSNDILTSAAYTNITSLILNAVRSLPSCGTCEITIEEIKNNATGTSVVPQQGGGQIGDILCDIEFTVSGAPQGTDFSNLPGLAEDLNKPSSYCPTGELPNDTSVLCAPSSGVTMLTTAELNDWTPAIIAAGIGLAGIAGLAAMQHYKGKKSVAVAPMIIVNEMGGAHHLGHQHTSPILVKGEADLLNDLNLTPANMSQIFKSDNVYAQKFGLESLKKWDTAISKFLESLTTQNMKCYKTKLLLTRSECEESKCFLYSIRDYLDDPTVNRIAQTTAMNEDTSEFNEPSLDTDDSIELNKVNFPKPQFRVEHGRATVRVGAIEKRTNNRYNFDLHLKEPSKGTVAGEPTPEEIEELKDMFEDKKRQYSSKYVMYLY